jgi:dTDP-4-dehydrorhamnose reductase
MNDARTRTVLILGGTGRLGGALASAARPSWTVHTPSREELDLEDGGFLDHLVLLEDLAPDVVINAAAMTHVDRCEERPEAAMAINAVGPGLLGAACENFGIPLVHVSTDYVFGDGEPPYTPGDSVCPVQHYGITKARGEREVLDSGARAVVARVSWLFGPDGCTFDRWVLEQVEGADSRVGVLTWQRSRPTWIPTLAQWLLAVAERLVAGVETPSILHPAGGPWASRAEWARRILDANGHDSIPVGEQAEAIWTRHAARRPVDSRLDAAATQVWAEQVGLPRIGDWRSWLDPETD